jgi:hypothetical protein
MYLVLTSIHMCSCAHSCMHARTWLCPQNTYIFCQILTMRISKIWVGCFSRFHIILLQTKKICHRGRTAKWINNHTTTPKWKSLYSVFWSYILFLLIHQSAFDIILPDYQGSHSNLHFPLMSLWIHHFTQFTSLKYVIIVMIFFFHMIYIENLFQWTTVVMYN